MKKLSTRIKKISLVRKAAAVAFMAVVFYMTAFTSMAAEGTITAETANIRKETSTDSEVVGSTVKGKKLIFWKQSKTVRELYGIKLPFQAADMGISEVTA